MLAKYKYVIVALIITVLTIIFGVGYLATQKDNPIVIDITQDTVQQTELSDKTTDENVLVIYITGEVINPGVYELKQGDRIIDAINFAGGTTSVAALDMINLASYLTDGDHIIIASINNIEDESEELSEDSAIIKSSSNTSEYKGDKKININTASKEELELLNQIGPTIANAIIQYRESNGNFKTIEDIQNVNRIGAKTFESIKDYITVN